MQFADEASSDKPGQHRGNGTLMLHLLGRCNLTCAHCYMEGAPQRRERLPLADVLDAVAACPALGVGNLYLTGGEPLLYPRLFQLLERASAMPALRTTLCTNGTLLSERRAQALARFGIQINVSIDGEAAYHDFLRGKPQAFAAAARGIRAATDAGAKVTIVATITQDNLHSLPALADFAVACAAGTLRVQPLLRLGRGVEIADRRLTPVQVDRLVLELSDLAARHRPVLHCSIIGQSLRLLQAHPCAAYVCNGLGCHRRIAREIKKIVVREDGTILPEMTNLDHRYAIGTLGEAPFGTLVERFMDDGYDAFDRLCRTVYAEVIPTWPAAIVPWDQLVAERSCTFHPGHEPQDLGTGCGTAVPERVLA